MKLNSITMIEIISGIPHVSAQIATPPANFIARTEVPVTVGSLKLSRETIDKR